ncbi:unnamed protein product [Owenia fusiformis]|uniref:alpha-amylase n=1 Tax=Owenia fusiformis TaxID=6347 RepID=A0A8J1YBK5_OWEFU|nr:unnamed protein product [Owenia fusiformis]
MEATKIIVVAIVAALSVCYCQCKSREEWKTRIIYQLLTDRFSNDNSNDGACGGSNYCGGTFRGVTNKLDYLQGLGITAIWISPVVENTDGGYHGYWAKDLYAINSHFGSADDLKNLVSECHKRDIWVMVDVVANHVGYPNGCPGCSMQQETDFSGFPQFNHTEHYHNYCDIKDWSNQPEVENCRLAQLPDLAQENSYVRQTLKDWIHNLVQDYNFDGIRIDTIPEVPKDFWSEFGQASGVFQIGEVDNGDPHYVSQYQGPLTATLNYPMYWKLRNVFQEKQSCKIISSGLHDVDTLFKDPSVLGGFLDNHDNPRFLNINSDWTALKNALAYNLMAKWIPIVYYGTEQGYTGGNDPGNRGSLWPNFNKEHQIYKFISIVTYMRNTLGDDFISSNQNERWADDQFYAFTRCSGEKVLIALTNQGSGASLQRTIPNLPYKNGQELTNVFDSNDQITANNGQVTVSIQNGQPKIYTVNSSMRFGDLENNSDDDPKFGTIMGGVIGGALGLVAMVIVVVVIRHKRSKNNNYEAI